MRKIFFSLIVVCFLTAGSSLYSVGPLDLHFRAGLSTPNDEVAKVYSDESFASSEVSDGSFFTENAALGYHLGVNARIDLSETFDFIGGVEYHRFPESDITVRNPESGEVITRLVSVNNVMPINAGVNFTFLDAELLKIYATGGFAYNYIWSSVDYKTESSASFPLDNSEPKESRAGFFAGVGTDIDLQLIMLNLEARYNQINLIGRDDGENMKSYISLSLGVVI